MVYRQKGGIDVYWRKTERDGEGNKVRGEMLIDVCMQIDRQIDRWMDIDDDNQTSRGGVTECT